MKFLTNQIGINFLKIVLEILSNLVICIAKLIRADVLTTIDDQLKYGFVYFDMQLH